MVFLASDPNDLSAEELKNLSVSGGNGRKSVVSTNIKTCVNFLIYLTLPFCLFCS